MKRLVSKLLILVSLTVLCTACTGKDAQEKLEKEVANEMKSLPMVMSDDVTWTSVVLRPDCVCYLYEVQGEATLESYRQKEGEIKSQVFLAMQDESFHDFVDCAVATDRGISYCYKDKKTNEQYEIKLSTDELKKAL